MSKVILGLIAGIVFGALDVGLMLPMSFPNKTTALLGAFASRFAIGFVIGCVQLPNWPGWLVGLLFGPLISLPDAIITHKYVPILIVGGIGGLIIGGLIHGWKVTSNRSMHHYTSVMPVRSENILEGLLRCVAQRSCGKLGRLNTDTP
jgi:hypothetical protein